MDKKRNNSILLKCSINKLQKLFVELFLMMSDIGFFSASQSFLKCTSLVFIQSLN